MEERIEDDLRLKRARKTVLIQVFVLFQFLVVALIINRKYPTITLAELFGTSLISLFLVLFIIIKYKTWKHGALNLLVIISFSLFIGLNVERIVFSDYYVILVKSADKMKTVASTEDFNKQLLATIDGLKDYEKLDGICYFYFELDSPIYCGIAYNSDKQTSSANFDAYGIIDKWVKLYGDWYFFISREFY